MGHLINPLSYRVYNIRYWNNNWFVHNRVNYSYIFINDILIFDFLKKFLNKYLKSTEFGVMFNSLKILRNYNKVNLYLYIHDGYFDMLLFKLLKNHKIYKLNKFVRRMLKKRYGQAMKKVRWDIVKRKNVNKIAFLNRYVRFRKYNFIKRYLKIFIKHKIIKVFWLKVKSIILYYLKKFDKNFFFSMYILSLSKKNVTANIITEYIHIRLKQYYTIFEILRSINYFLKGLLYKKKLIKGYKIMCAGRFSRKQRATYSWKTFGSLSLSTMKANLDYNYTTIALKYSNCAIKVWIRLRKKKKFLFDFIV